MYLAKSPIWLQWLYPSLTWHKLRTEKSIYLTFDDGPVPVVTPFVLKTLNTFNAKATFFCIGDNVLRFPDLYAELLSNGHAVGNHTFNHLKGWDISTAEYLTNVQKCAELVQTKLFRPPYGRIKKSQISAIKSALPDTEVIMWDVLSGDFDRRISPEKCIQNVLKNTRNGSIIVFHDSDKAFERLEIALPAILRDLTIRGFEFKLL